MSMNPERNVAVAVFENRSDAQQAVNDLRQAGFSEDQIGIAARDEDRETRAVGDEGEESKVGEGAGIGAAVGAGGGALWALAIAAGVLPAIGPVVAGGILAALIASAAGGAVVGGLVGALIGLGVPEEEAQYYEEEFRAGRTLVTVRADGRYNEAVAILQRNNGYDIHTARERATTAGAVGTAHTADYTGEERIELREEELHATKEEVPAGEARIRKEVVQETERIEVPVKREELVVERHPVAEHEADEPITAEGEEIRVPLREERVRAEKETVVGEEVTVGKRTVHGTATVEDEVKREELRVEEEAQEHPRHPK